MSTTTGLPAYAFLSQPPPAIQKRQKNLGAAVQAPSLPLPPTPQTSAPSAIASWAAQVQPGSPGTPSPRRSSLSGSRRPSLVRRHSGSKIAHIRVPSNSQSFIRLIDTPSSTAHRSASPSVATFAPNTADLRAQGYTSIFVSLPSNTPQSAFPFKFKQSQPEPLPSASSKPTKTLAHFRSLSVLRPSRRGKSTVTPSSPTKKHSIPGSPTKHTAPSSIKRVRSGSKSCTKPSSPTIARRRAMHRKAQVAPPFANQALLMQFMGGGKLETHAQALMPEGDAVYRDGNGGLWRDEAERVEWVPLLDDSDEEKENSPTSPGRTWVRFSSGRATEWKQDSKAVAILDFATQDDDKEDMLVGRRGSAGSICTAEMIVREPMKIDQDMGKIVWLPPSGVKRTARRRHRPTPLNLTPVGTPSASAPASAFEDSFAPAPVPGVPSLNATGPTASSSMLALPLVGAAFGAPSPISCASENQRTLKTKASRSKLHAGMKRLLRI